MGGGDTKGGGVSPRLCVAVASHVAPLPLKIENEFNFLYNQSLLIMPNFCVECKKTGATQSNIFNKLLCSVCKNSDAYKMVYKTTAKKEYFLTDADIGRLETFDGPKIRRNFTTLIKLTDVKNAFCKKFSVELSQIDEAKDQIEISIDEEKTRKRDLRDERKYDLKVKRKKSLEDELAKYNLVLRDDSNLCQGYINGSIKDWSLDQIVNRMCQMHYLYNYTDMEKYLEEARTDYYETIKAGYFPDCSIQEDAELKAVGPLNNYPVVWPWMEKPLMDIVK